VGVVDRQVVCMFGSFPWVELLRIFIIVLIIFGSGKLPQMGEGIGKAIKGFKKSVHDAEEEAVQHSAEPCMTVSETIPNIGASSEKQFLPPYLKDIT
jgi:sec-independent protein translocase protein TatA